MSATFHSRMHVDVCRRNEIEGWIDEGKDPESFDLVFNGKPTGQLLADRFRPDLQRLGLGDGRRGYAIVLPRQMTAGDLIELKRDDKTVFAMSIFSRATGGLMHSIHVTPPAAHAHEFSQQWWREGVLDEGGLTFGATMTGDALWDVYCRYRKFLPTDEVLEIAPGYGRILSTALDRKIPFSSYTGVDISADRVAKLRSRFKDARVRFEEGDIDEWRGNHQFDVVLCSSTFEHLHPDCRRALANIKGQLRRGATLLIDFIASDTPASRFVVNGAYVRSYPLSELQDIFGQASFRVKAIDRAVIGKGEAGDISRFLVAAVS